MVGKLLLLISAVACSQAIMCPKNACQNVQCTPGLTVESCGKTGGYYKVNGGFCGCCDVCISLLNEGDQCGVMELLGAEQHWQCAEGLFCNPNTEKCELIAASCAIRRAEIEDVVSKLKYRPLGLTLPRCDDDGSYAGKQCRGSVCFCVDKAGNRIGYEHNLWESDEEIACNCARDKADYASTKLVGKHFHCTTRGDYEQVQCQGSICYCADRKTGKQVSEVVIHISKKDQLECDDSD